MAPSEFVPEAAPRALPASLIIAAITGRTFHVDICTGGSQLGIQVAVLTVLRRLRVISISTEGAIDGWNRMCARTFPPDAVRVGDYILRVNHVSANAEGMLDVLRRRREADAIFLVVWRCGDLEVGA